MTNPSTFEWAALEGRTTPAAGLFVAQVIGESMNRRIPNGAWGVWRLNPAGSRQGKVVLIEPVTDEAGDLPEVEAIQEIPRLRFVQPARYGVVAPPEVIEDGIAGTVQFEVRNAEGAGPACLVRGDRREPLFRGMWCDSTTARAYARSHGHAFEEIDAEPDDEQ